MDTALGLLYLPVKSTKGGGVLKCIKSLSFSKTYGKYEKNK